MSIAPQSRNLLLALLFGLLLSACTGIYIKPLPVGSTPAERKVYLVSEIDHILDTQQDASKPGVSVMIAKDGDIVYSRSKGMADINQGTSITENTVFNIASVAKPITAIAVMQLMERRLLSLDDSVLKWIPSLPPAWQGITIRHLLSHTSGIPNYLNMQIVQSGQIRTLDGIDNQQLIQRFAADGTLLFAPGTRGNYSNSNYVLLAEIISRAAAKPYAQYLQENIFIPLGMRATFVYGNTPLAGTSVALNYGRDTKIYAVTLATVGPFGIFSSISDLATLSKGLLAGKLVSMEDLRLMTSPQSGSKVVDEWRDTYGYGWFVPPQEVEPRTFWHSGNVDGFRTVLKIADQKGVEFIMLCNGGQATENIMRGITYVVNQAYRLGAD